MTTSADGIDVGPYRLAYRSTGDGPPVLLLHSGGLSSRQWRRLADALAPSHRVLTPDFLGYGGSTRWPVGEPFDFRLDVDAIVALIDAIGGPVSLVGHSYGGLIAAHAALRRPDAVAALALYEPVTFGVLDAPEDEAVRGELASLRMVYEPGADGADDRWLSAFVDWWNGPGAWAALQEEVRASFRAVGWKLFQEVVSLARDTTGRGAYGAVRARALVLGGDRSPAVEHRVVERLASALPGGEARFLPGLGHMGPITHAPAVNEAILAHVR
jgi:pimeloyl-ACP methyl ester carboxylesterase